MRPGELKAWRQRLGLTQEAAGGRLGVTRVTIQNWENGETPISKVVECTCRFYLEHWQKQQAQRPDHGPVALIYSDKSLWIGPDGRFGMMQREPFPNNEAALQRVRDLWGRPNFQNPLIVDESGDMVWNFRELQREIERRTAQDRAAAETTDLADELLAIGERLARLPAQDNRGADEILGYDEDGIPR